MIFIATLMWVKPRCENENSIKPSLEDLSVLSWTNAENLHSCDFEEAF